MKYITKPEDLAPNEVFVFGSNEAGIHGAGAARTAWKVLGAKRGVGFGPTGRCYAIPTKDRQIQTLPLKAIQCYVEAFLREAALTPGTRYIVSPIGCGLAGYAASDIAPMFQNAPSNVVLPEEFCNLPLAQPGLRR